MPIVAIVVVVSLGLGIGANTVVFAWIQALVLKPIPGVRNPSAFHTVDPITEHGGGPGASWLEFQDLRQRLTVFEDLLAFRMTPLMLGEVGNTERAYGLLVSANYFAALGLEPAAGRFFRPDEVARPGGEPVVVISYAFWRNRYGMAGDVVGRVIRVNERDLAIVGVAPERFQGTVLGLDFDMWVPATLAPALITGSRELDRRDVRGYTVMGRLDPGVTRQAANAAAVATMADLARLYPETNRAISGEVLPFWQARRGPQRMFVTALGVLQAVMLLLLLAVCGNTANLLLARASVRQREFALRLALGAGRARIASLLLTENMLLAVLGVVLGLVLAFWGTNALRAVPMTGAFPIRFQTGLDLVSVAFAAALGFGSALACGLAPAIQAGRLDPQLATRAGAIAPPRNGLRHALMAVEVACALAVLVAAALFLKSFREGSTDPGFRRDGLLLAAYDMTGREVTPDAARTFAARLVDRLRQLPSVQHAAIAAAVPLDIHGMSRRTFTVEGHARDDGGEDETAFTTVTPDYFAALDLARVAGSDFADLLDAGAPKQAIVNEAFVAAYLPDLDPIGRRVITGGATYTIAGVVRTSRYDAFDEPPTPMLYLSYRDRPSGRGEIHVSTRPGAEAGLASDIQRVVRELDPMLPIYDVRTMNEHIEKSLFLRRIPARMFFVLGPLLVVLAAIGVYAVVAYSVSQRTREIGLRLALGATGPGVVRQVAGESFAVVVVGALAGWLLAFAAGLHLVPGGRIDPAVFGGVPLILLGIAALACWMPARRAAHTDPMIVLKQE
jgi:predicted permease